MPIGPYPDFATCVAAQKKKGKDDNAAKKICGFLEKQSRSGSNVEIDDQNDHLFLRAFLLDSSVNQNAWGVSPDTLQQNIQTYIGKPLVVQEDFQHPDSGDPNYEHHLQYQEKFRIGNIVGIAENKGIYSAIVDVTDPNAKDAFRQGNLPLYVSPQLFHDGVGKEADDNAATWRGTHLAIVNEPAYGAVKARVTGQCNGDSKTCLAQLKRASCNFCIKETIKNYVSNKSNQSNSSLEKNSRTYNSKLAEVKDETIKETIQTVSIEEFNKIKQALETMTSERDALKQTNTQITEENKTVSASLDSLKGEYRKDKVSSILANVFYKTDEDRSTAVESFTKSGMTYEEIDKHVAPLRTVKQASTQETKLPQKSAASEEEQESESPFISLWKSQFGGSR